MAGTSKTLKPILLIAHLDVVEALRSDWSLDPYKLTEKDGFFYGRGTSDIKGRRDDAGHRAPSDETRARGARRR